MLEFLQDNKKVQINAIYGKGQVGQMVIYGELYDWGTNPNPTIFPLSKYPCPSLFTIIEKKEEYVDGYYILSDIKGNKIKLNYFYSRSGASVLYDAQEWLTWNDMYQKEKLFQKQVKIEQLEGYVELLKDILIKQGDSIVTEA